MPPALAGRDVLGLAQTGTGKTAAFVLPILERLLVDRRPGLRALVVAPTRELASQVHADFERLAKFTPLTSTPIFGGVPIPRQIRALQRKPDIVVACPGRLLDLLSQRALRLDKVEVLVLDEADHMFDMGFLPDVRRILAALPARRQNLMFSATMPREIRKLADAILREPAVVELAHSRPAETIAHALYPLEENEKVGVLEKLLSGEDFRSAIVFLRTKRRAKKLAERLDSRGHAAIAMQGNMSQPQRERALAGFRGGRYDVLVATDIAARGLDIAGVSHVVNFDVPNTPDAYTHRIGRTGRSEQSGQAFTFVTHDDSAAVRAIEKRLGAPIERRRLSELGAIERSSLAGGKKGSSGRGSRSGSGRTERPYGSPTRPAQRARPAASRGVRKRRVAPELAPETASPRARVESGPAFGQGIHDDHPATRRTVSAGGAGGANRRSNGKPLNPKANSARPGQRRRRRA